MIPRQFQRRILLFVCLVGFAASSDAQHVTRINPRKVSLRAVSLSSLWTGMIVGDSGYVAVTHDAVGANAWSAHPSPFDPSIGVLAVAYAGDTAHVVIAGTRGSLAASSDGGETWSVVNLGTSATIRALTWNHATAPPVVVAVGDGGLVARSIDQGKTWTTVSSTSTAQLNAISFGTAMDAFAVGNDTTLLQTHDAGQTWLKVPFGYDLHSWHNGFYDTIGKIDFVAVAMGGTDSLWVAARHGISPLFYYQGTPDTSAAAWSRTFGKYDASSSSIQPTFTSMLYVGMPKFLNCFVTTISDIEISNRSTNVRWEGGDVSIVGDADGGIDPCPLRIRGSAFWRVSTTKDTTMVMILVGDECNIIRYPWTPHVNGADMPFNSIERRFPLPGRQTSTEFLDVEILPNGFGYTVGVGERFQRTSDYGRTWTDAYIPITSAGNINGSDSAINSVHVFDSSSALIVGWSGIILRYSDTGCHFVPSGTTERLHGIAFPSKDTGLIVGDFGTILHSTDAGESWNSIPTTAPGFLYAVAFCNPRIGVAVGENGAILRTTDEGETWNDVNNILTGTQTSIREVQAFPGGTFLARAESEILRSIDYGQTWGIAPSPIGDSLGMSFYNTQIGIIAERATSSGISPDSVVLAYTRDAGAHWAEFTVGMWNYSRVLFHWLSDHEVLLYRIDGFIVDVDLSGSEVKLTRVDPAAQLSIAVSPNPSSGDARFTYDTKVHGLTTIELIDESGKLITCLFQGEETVGEHSHSVRIPTELHGTFIVRLSANGESSVTKLIVP